MYNEGYAVIAIPELARPVKHFPVGVLDAMIDNKFEWAAKNRKRILKEWQARYDFKSEPKGQAPGLYSRRTKAGCRHSQGWQPAFSFFSGALPC